MDHIREHDWTTQLDNVFITEKDMDNCVIEKILRNRFRDPLLSDSEEEDDDDDGDDKWSWDCVFKKFDNKQVLDRSHKLHVAGYKGLPQYPKISSLTLPQHRVLLRIMCAEQPHVLRDMHMPTPVAYDFKFAQSLSETYEKEQEEYKAWARSVWAGGGNVRALRPPRVAEVTYEALRAIVTRALPARYRWAAQLPITSSAKSELTLLRELHTVEQDALAQIVDSEEIDRLKVFRQFKMPTPCEMHPTQRILPGESEPSSLPLPGVQNVMARWGAERGARAVISEEALRCLLRHRDCWTLPLTVCEAQHAAGANVRMVVLDSEAWRTRHNPQERMHRAIQTMLREVLVSISEKLRLNKRNKKDKSNSGDEPSAADIFADLADGDDDDEDMRLVIDDPNDDAKGDGEMNGDEPQEDENCDKDNPKNKECHQNGNTSISSNSEQENTDVSGGKSKCTCKETAWTGESARSWRLWRCARAGGNAMDVVVHCVHWHKDGSTELVTDGVVEYQAELGASELNIERLATLALALRLRKSADREVEALIARIDAVSGEILRCDRLTCDELMRKTEDVMERAANVVYTTLEQLAQLVPGDYLLHHEAGHGENVMLYAARGGSGDELSLEDSTTTSDDASTLRVAPKLCADLLPYHKFCRTLPLAFSPYPEHVAKEPRRPAKKLKHPPRALQWPKKKKGKKKKN